MYTKKSKKSFTEPMCEVSVFELSDIITTSGGDDWDMGEEPFAIAEIQSNWSMGETD